MATTNAQAVAVERGAFCEFGANIGMVETSISLVGAVAGESLGVFTFAAPTLVLACGAEVTTVNTDGTTIDLGVAEDSAIFVNAGVTSSKGQIALAAQHPTMIAAAGRIVMSIDAYTGTTGVVRVWAIVADPGKLNGAAASA